MKKSLSILILAILISSLSIDLGTNCLDTKIHKSLRKKRKAKKINNCKDKDNDDMDEDKDFSPPKHHKPSMPTMSPSAHCPSCPLCPLWYHYIYLN